MPLSCRFYQRQFPEVDDVVVVNIRTIAEMGAYVHLLEYNNTEGMILMSEITRRRIRSINKLIRVGRNECVMVIRVDHKKGYIDLSKRRVLPEDIARCTEKFAKGKAVNSILRHVADLLEYTTDDQLETLFQKTAWYFDEKHSKDGACYDVFKKAVSDPAVLDECRLDDRTKEVLLANIVRRLQPQSVKLRADIEVWCYKYEGIEAVKKALHAGLECSTEEMPIKINLIAPPVYQMTTTTFDQKEGVEALNKAIDRIRDTIQGCKGCFKLQREPQVFVEESTDAVEEVLGLSDELSDEDELTKSL